MKTIAATLALAAVAAFAQSAAIPSARPPLAVAQQGAFSSGGRVTAPRPGEYDPTQNWLDPQRKGTTAHVDHANTFFQLPAAVTGAPVVFLHGYGQTRTCWQTTPDGREGWSDRFLRAEHPVFLVDQPRRSAAGATERINTDPLDVEDGAFKPGEQAWYTHFRIGRIAPGRYEGSQFPEGDEALTQFFCQMTPSTGNYDERLFGQVLSAVLADVRTRTGRKAVYVTHSQGGRVGWATDAENVAAIVAVEPGFAPQVGSPEYKKFLAGKIPMLFLFGDYIENGPEDIKSTGFWRAVLAQCRSFAAQYVKDGGDATVLSLPDLGIRGNSHFLFQERNSDQLADLVENWLRAHGLAAPQPATANQTQEIKTMSQSILGAKELALAKIGIAVARGEQDALAKAYEEGFAAGLLLDEAKEVVGQLYAYCGFPRALNAAATLMKVQGLSAKNAKSAKVISRRDAEAQRKENGANQPFVLGEMALEIGAANQTKLCGGPVAGPLFDFHPQLDAYLKAHLFGDIFSRKVLDWRTRELVTVAALAARPETAPQCASHVRVAQLNGVTPAETDAILDLARRPADPAALPKDWSAIPVGEPNTAYAKYFSGRSYLHQLTLDQVPAFGVTFEPNCRNHWHIHHAKTGGGQILIVTAGEGWYQEWGKERRRLKKGDTVNIPAGVKHWHGAADCWFQHIAIEVPGTGTKTEWCEPVAD
ncbi:MAG: alpha/beta fold hydrolase [Kiritimatiellia bacterium]